MDPQLQKENTYLKLSDDIKRIEKAIKLRNLCYPADKNKDQEM